MEHKDMQGSSEDSQIMQMFVTKDKLKADMPTGTGEGASTVIFRGDKDLLWVIDHEKKSYTVLDKETLEEVSGKMDAMMKQMEEQLAKLPPEQRKMIEEQMKGNLPGGQEVKMPSVEVKKTGRKDKIAGHSCVLHEVLVDGEKDSEVWVASWGDVGVTEDDFQAFRDMAGFFESMFESSSFLQQGVDQAQPFQIMDEVDGFPVLIRDIENGEIESETVLRSIDKRSLGSEVFEIPEGYKETKMMEP
jgi:hypothetical protein